MKAWIVCISAALFFAYELVQFHMLNAISPLLMKDLGINGIEFGYLCSTYLLADVCFLLPAGVLLDHFSTRKVILTALVLCILGTVGFSLSHSLATTCFFHFLSGIGNAFCFLSCMLLVSQWFPKEKHAFVMGIVVTVGMLGGVIAQMPFSKLATSFGWRETLMIDAAIGCLIFLLNFLFVEEKARETHKGNFSFREAFQNKEPFLCGLYTGLMNLPVMVIGAMLGSLFLTHVHDFSLTYASFTTGLICFGTILGSPFFGKVADKLENRRAPMLFGAVVSTVIMFVLMFAKPLSPWVFLLLGFFSSTQVIGYAVITSSTKEEMTGTSMGIAAVIIMGLAALAQPLAGHLIDWSGSTSYCHQDFIRAFWMFPIGFVIAFVCGYYLEKKPAPALSRSTS